MSDAPRKRDSDGLPKQDLTRVDGESHAIMALLPGIRFEEKFRDHNASLSREEGLSRIKKGDRETLMAICISLAIESGFLDSVAFSWYFYSRTCGRLNFSVVKGFKESSYHFNINGDGQLTELRITRYCGKDRYCFAMPAIIGRLPKLQSISVRNCKSIPHHVLSKLPKLERLVFEFHLDWCTNKEELQTSYESMMNCLLMSRLPHLKSFRFLGFRFKSLQSLFQWIQEYVPSLEDLYLKVTREAITASCTPISYTNTMHHHKNLTSIQFSQCGMDEGHLEYLLFDVLPHFPMVSKINFGNNKIKSFRSIDQRLSTIHGNGAVYKPPLEAIGLHYDTCFWENADPEEIGAFCRVLHALSTIQDIRDFNRRCFNNLPRRVCNELLLNRAGRRFVEDARFKDPPLPLSIWSLVLGRLTRQPSLERQKSILAGLNLEGDTQRAIATGLFYFLRNGPMLLMQRDSKKDEQLH